MTLGNISSYYELSLGIDNEGGIDKLFEIVQNTENQVIIQHGIWAIKKIFGMFSFLGLEFDCDCLKTFVFVLTESLKKEKHENVLRNSALALRYLLEGTSNSLTSSNKVKKYIINSECLPKFVVLLKSIFPSIFLNIPNNFLVHKMRAF